MSKNNGSGLDTAFAALSDPTRRAIMQKLVEGQASVSELAEPFNISLPAVSKHLRVLEEAGLLTRKRVGRFHWIRARTQPMRDIQKWVVRYNKSK